MNKTTEQRLPCFENYLLCAPVCTKKFQNLCLLLMLMIQIVKHTAQPKAAVTVRSHERDKLTQKLLTKQQQT